MCSRYCYRRGIQTAPHYCDRSLLMSAVLISIFRAHHHRRQFATMESTLISFIKAKASARRAVTTHVRRTSTGQEHARVSRMGIHARRARILAVQPTTTALGLVRALATTLCATNAHTTVTSASIGVHAVVRVRAHVRIAPTSLLMLSTPNRVLSIPMTVLGNALRCITSRTASVQAVRTSRAHPVRIALVSAATAQVMDSSV